MTPPLAALACLSLVAAGALVTQPAFEGMTADQLVARVTRQTRPSSSYRIRATLTKTIAATGSRDVHQLLIKRHRDRRGAHVLFEQLWPTEGAGRTLVLDNTHGRPAQGFLYEGGRVIPLTPQRFGARFLDSDLLIDDMVERFWSWPAPRLVGEEAVGEHRCAIVEFRPAPATATPYSMIRAWISPDLLIGLRIQQYGSDGRMVKQIDGYRILKVDDRWVAGIVSVEPADGRSRTVIEATKYEADPTLTAEDFTIDAIRRSASARAR